MRILNLYAGIGGNRKFWGNSHEITAVELNQEIAKVYQDFFPGDTVIVGDAHNFLLENYRKFDFIWVSPPCQSHSKIRACGVWHGQYEAIYPDMKLYQEIIFLQKFTKCDWVVENVLPYYKPLITPTFTMGRHYFWSNKFIIDIGYYKSSKHNSNNKDLELRKGFDLSKYKLKNKTQILRNCVEPELGKYILDKVAR